MDAIEMSHGRRYMLHSSRSCGDGFTLIEIAVVLFVLGIIIAGLIGPLQIQLEARDREQTTATMDEILDAITGFAISNGRLPCPNTDGAGLEEIAAPGDAISGGACLAAEGFLPWANLGVPQADAWGNRFRYRVTTPAFTTVETDEFCNGDDHFDLCAAGNLTVKTRGDNPSTPTNVEGKFTLDAAVNVPAVIISHGRNGAGATTANGIARPAPPSSTDEAENTNADETFYSRTYTAESSSCDETNEANSFCAFDDIVKWISPVILNNRMVTSGRLP